MTQEFTELERELNDRGVTVWVASLPPQALAMVSAFRSRPGVPA